MEKIRSRERIWATAIAAQTAPPPLNTHPNQYRVTHTHPPTHTEGGGGQHTHTHQHKQSNTPKHPPTHTHTPKHTKQQKQNVSCCKNMAAAALCVCVLHSWSFHHSVRSCHEKCDLKVWPCDKSVTGIVWRSPLFVSLFFRNSFFFHYCLSLSLEWCLHVSCMIVNHTQFVIHCVPSLVWFGSEEARERERERDSERARAERGGRARSGDHAWLACARAFDPFWFAREPVLVNRPPLPPFPTSPPPPPSSLRRGKIEKFPLKLLTLQCPAALTINPFHPDCKTVFLIKCKIANIQVYFSIFKA